MYSATFHRTFLISEPKSGSALVTESNIETMLQALRLFFYQDLQKCEIAITNIILKQ